MGWTTHRAVTTRGCARPGCPETASATLSFRYASREVHLAELAAEPDPQTYDLCASHAERTRPPSGWELSDERRSAARAATVEGPVPAIGDPHTVGVLARALGRDEPPRPPVPRGPAPALESATPPQSAPGPPAATLPFEESVGRIEPDPEEEVAEPERVATPVRATADPDPDDFLVDPRAEAW